MCNGVVFGCVGRSPGQASAISFLVRRSGSQNMGAILVRSKYRLYPPNVSLCCHRRCDEPGSSGRCGDFWPSAELSDRRFIAAVVPGPWSLVRGGGCFYLGPSLPLDSRAAISDPRLDFNAIPPDGRAELSCTRHSARTGQCVDMASTDAQQCGDGLYVDQCRFGLSCGYWHRFPSHIEQAGTHAPRCKKYKGGRGHPNSRLSLSACTALFRWRESA